jgi:calcineurin-like phosphoesterase family protein
VTESYDKPKRSPEAVTYKDFALVSPDKILLAGDTHGDSGHVKNLLERARDVGARAVFVLGDFGIWDHHDGGKFTDMVSKLANRYEIPVLFLPGNHDNYDLLFEWEAEKPRTADGFYEIKPGLFYSPRGHRWTWSGVSFLSLGGAYSVDKDWRYEEDQNDLERIQLRHSYGGVPRDKRERYLLKTGQYHWWNQEEISEQEMRDAMVGGPVDIMLAHDKPRSSTPGWNRKDLEECWPNQERLQAVVDAVLPQLYMHGHLHYAYEAVLSQDAVGHETFLKALDCDPSASRSSGGSGRANRSWAVLEIADDCFSLEWTDADGEKTHRDFDLSVVSRAGS